MTIFKTLILPPKIKFFTDDQQKKYPCESDADIVQH